VDESDKDGMTLSQTAERVIVRYGDALYRLALLCDANPRQAAKAVVTAFARIDWAAAPVDAELYAKLVRSLPPASRLRVQRRRSEPALPPAFLKLPPLTRLALGLRLLDGMSVDAIAPAIGKSTAETRTALVDGVATCGVERLKIDPACRAHLQARLQEAALERGRPDRSPSCGDIEARWDRAAEQLGEALRLAMGQFHLPAAARSAIMVALQQARGLGHPPPKSRRLLPFLAVLLGVALVLVALVAPRGAGHVQPAGGALAPRQIVEQARKAYGAAPQGSGIVHRRWHIMLDQPQLSLQADEWVDTGQPARHRMQLTEGKAIKEWATGDGRGEFRYLSNDAQLFCGALPRNVQANEAVINLWKLDGREQEQMRAARWRTAPWSIGLRYLEQAARASSIRSLGLSGSGASAVLTLAVQDAEVDGTLLLRFDPVSYELREVREVRLDNGRTEQSTPWRLDGTETVDSVTALRQGVLTDYPFDWEPRSIKHEGRIVDRACPLVDLRYTLDFPQALGQVNAGVGVLGLPVPPPELQTAILVAARGDGPSGMPRGYMAPELTQFVYVGVGKRLVLRPERIAQGQHTGGKKLGHWMIQLDQQFPGVFSGRAESGDNIFDPAGAIQIWAEGWNKDELAALLATVRPLRFDDWARAPDLYFALHPLASETRTMLAHLVAAQSPRPNMVHHRVELTTVRQAPFLATLADPYHLSPSQNPAQKRIESWTEVDRSGSLLVRSRQRTAGLDGALIEDQIRNGDAWRGYQARSNQVTSGTAPSPWWVPLDYRMFQLLRFDWSFHTAPDRSILAEATHPLGETDLSFLLQSQERGDQWGYEPWLLDVKPITITYRLRFGPDGRLQASETIGDATYPGEPTARKAPRPVLLEHTVVETDEWVPSVPVSAWTFAPPFDAIVIEVPAPSMTEPNPAPRQPRVTRSLTETAQAAPFELWTWPQSLPLLEFRDARLPPLPLAPARWWEGGNDEAIVAGLAAKLYYGTPRGGVNVTQGPTEGLRRFLQQQLPAWRRSELRTIREGQAAPVEVWVMYEEAPGQQWAVFERGGSLLFLNHVGPEDELNAILRAIPQLQRIPGAP
jgi:hypothetical protein